MFELEQQQSFRLTAAEMKRRRGVMSLRELSIFAEAALTEIAAHWTADRRRAVSDRIASSISTRFDITKVRSAPKISRGDRARRDRAIVEFVIGSTKRPSIQTVSDKFGVSFATVQRVFANYGLTEPSAKRAGRISPTALEIMRLFEVEFPSAAHRLVALSDIARAISVPSEDVLRSLPEINSLRQPLQLFDTKVPTRQGGSSWLIIQRGKGKSESDLRNWARPHLEASRQASSSRIDARYILKLTDPRLPLNPVLRDVATVVMISQHSTALRTWRSFIEASTVLGGQQLPSTFTGINDPESLITVLNGALRLHQLEELLGRMHMWPLDPVDQNAAKSVFGHAQWLRTDIFFRPMEAFYKWSEKTSYKERINAGKLPGRALSDFENLSYYEDIEDADELIESFRQNGRQPVAPIYPGIGTAVSKETYCLHPYLEAEWVHPSETDSVDGYIPSPEDDF